MSSNNHGFWRWCEDCLAWMKRRMAFNYFQEMVGRDSRRRLEEIINQKGPSPSIEEIDSFIRIITALNEALKRYPYPFLSGEFEALLEILKGLRERAGSKEASEQLQELTLV